MIHLIPLILLLSSIINPTMEPVREWRPYPKQEQVMASPAFEVLFGGAAYPGKTEMLVIEALRQIWHPRYNAVLFRRTYPMLEGADGMISRSKMWYPAYGGRYNEGKHAWTFPSGAHIFFRHLENIADLEDYQGHQYQYIAFDELSQFLEQMYLYMFSRCRAPADVFDLRCYIRSGSNPGGYVWVKRRFVKTGIANKIAYFKRVNDQDVRTTRDDPDGKSRSFIPATYRDNPGTTQDYVASMKQLSDIDQLRLADGDWDAEDSSDRVYPQWSYENIDDSAEYNPDFGPVYWAVDDGYAHGKGKGTDSYHPRVVLFIQKTPIGGINVFNERYATGEADYNITIDAILGTAEEPKNPHLFPMLVYIDSSAAMFKGALNSRGITVTGATHSVVEGLKNIRRLIKDANGMRLLKTHPRCTEFNEEMASYGYGSTPILGGDRKPLKVDDHGPDAIRYFAWHTRHTFGRDTDAE